MALFLDYHIVRFVDDRCQLQTIAVANGPGVSEKVEKLAADLRQLGFEAQTYQPEDLQQDAPWL